MKGTRNDISQTALYQISALMLFVGAVLVTAGNLLGPPGGVREAVASGMYYPAAVVVLFGGVLVMAGLPAVYLRQRADSGVLGFVAIMAVFAAGMLLIVGFALIQVLIFPWIATMNVSNKVLNDGPASFTIFFGSRQRHRLAGWGPLRSGHRPGRPGSSPAGSASAASYSLRPASFSGSLVFQKELGGGGIAMSWWWATTGTFGVTAYMVAMAGFAIELLLQLKPGISR